MDLKTSRAARATQRSLVLGGKFVTWKTLKDPISPLVGPRRTEVANNLTISRSTRHPPRDLPLVPTLRYCSRKTSDCSKDHLLLLTSLRAARGPRLQTSSPSFLVQGAVDKSPAKHVCAARGQHCHQPLHMAPPGVELVRSATQVHTRHNSRDGAAPGAPPAQEVCVGCGV